MSMTIIALSESLDFTAADSLLEQVKEARGQDLQLDASRVNRLGAACLQVLLSAAMTWASDGKIFQLTPRSPPVDEFLRLMGAELPA